MEYLPNGELFDYVWERQGLQETEAREMFTHIVEGVHHCHLVRETFHHRPMHACIVVKVDMQVQIM